MMNDNLNAVLESGKPRIFLVRGQEVMLDEDLAAIYEVAIGTLHRVVASNIGSFPEGAVFVLSPNELASLETQFADARREPPFVFTGPGLTLLSSILLEECEAHDGAEGCAPTCSCRS